MAGYRLSNATAAAALVWARDAINLARESAYNRAIIHGRHADRVVLAQLAKAECQAFETALRHVDEAVRWAHVSQIGTSDNRSNLHHSIEGRGHETADNA